MTNPSKRYPEICKLCGKAILPTDSVSNVRLSLLDPVRFHTIIISNKSYPDIVHTSCFTKAFKKEWERVSVNASC